VEMRTVCTRMGTIAPFSFLYSTVTWVLPSGRSQLECTTHRQGQRTSYYSPAWRMRLSVLGSCEVRSCMCILICTSSLSVHQAGGVLCAHFAKRSFMVFVTVFFFRYSDLLPHHEHDGTASLQDLPMQARGT